jgi:hypothetical protein
MYYWEAVFQHIENDLFVVIRGVFRYENPDDAEKEFKELCKNHAWLRKRGITSKHRFLHGNIFGDLVS